MTWTLFGRQTTNPFAIAVIIVICLVTLPPTVPLHLAARLFGYDGFIYHTGFKSNYEPGPFWTAFANTVVYGLLIALVIL